MGDWSDRVEQLLFDGEAVEREVTVGAATVAVTSHRVLAFTPQADGSNYRAIDRPNVTGVERRSVSRFGVLPRAVQIGVAGLLLGLVGFVVDPAALLPRPDVSSAPGAGGVVGTLETAIGLVHALDTILLGLGGVLVVLAGGLVGVELATRRERIAIAVAGEEPDELLSGPAGDDAVLTLDDLFGASPGNGSDVAGSEPGGTDGDDVERSP